MKQFLLSLIFTMQVCTPAFAQSAANRIVEGAYFPNVVVNKNYVKNASCDKNVNDITASGGSLTSSSTNAIKGAKSCNIDASSSAQTYTWALHTSELELKGQNCEARFVYSGDASLYKAYVKFGSTQITANLQLLSSTSGTQPVSINFPCGDNSAALTVVIEATSASAAAIIVDDVYVGLATNLSNLTQANFVGGMTAAGAAGCVFAETTSSGLTDFIDLGVGTSCGTPAVTGNVTAQATNDHRIVVSNQGAGEYVFILGGMLSTSGANTCVFRITDGTLFSQYENISATSATSPTLNFHMTLPSTGWPRTFKVQAADDLTGCRWNAGDAAYQMSWRVYRYPTTNELAARPTITPAYWSGYHDDTCSWTLTSTSFTDYGTDASCAVVQRQASNVSCVATGSVLPKIACTLPVTGAYYVCATGSPYGSVAGGHGHQLWDGTTVISTASDIATAAPAGVTMCGIYNATTLTPTFSWQSQASSGTNVLQSQRAGAKAIEWSVLQLSPNFQAPIFVGSVTSGAAGAERMERVTFGTTSSTVCSASPCAYISQSGTWISSIVRNSAGNYTLTMPAGTWSSATSLTCTGTSAGVGTAVSVLVRVDSATQLSVFSYDGATPTATDALVAVHCMGAK